MKKSIFDGASATCDKTLSELCEMMASSEMKDFTVACDELSRMDSDEAFEIMRPYLDHKDKYRRLYVLKTIFRHPRAADISYYLEEAILSSDKLFVENGLLTVGRFGIKIPEEIIWFGVENSDISYNDMRAIKLLDASPENYKKILDLFFGEGIFNKRIYWQKIFIADILREKYFPEKAEELYHIFATDGLAYIRFRAMKIADDFGFDKVALLEKIRTGASRLAESKFAFLSVYADRMLVDLSDDMESAMLYNPNSDEHIFVEYESDEYTVYFATDHVHLEDADAAAEWIRSVVDGEICAIEFFSGNRPCFGGSIDSSKLSDITYSTLENNDLFCFFTPLFSRADNFKIRDWSGKNNTDGRIFEKDGVGEIECIRV